VELFSPAAHRNAPVSAWWDGEVVYFGAGRKIYRRQLVLAACNKDGGAHVDADIPADYRWIREGTGFAFTVERSDGQKKENVLPAPHLACLRQIAHEVFNSPEFLKLAGSSITYGAATSRASSWISSKDWATEMRPWRWTSRL